MGKSRQNRRLKKRIGYLEKCQINLELWILMSIFAKDA
ncbi:hypothetical protein PI172_0718 [Prevotella intermedia]|uniref:Uncharacterized protein n=1 Tax=Prevotella intermedia TaxID=28131 RepID=A0AAD1BI51_PREIN|nr:hypothetical protein PI172_0718 [Prevotella intermedia]